MSKLVQGSDLFMANMATGVVTEISDVESIDMGKPTADSHEDTNLSEREWKSYKKGLKDAGDSSITIFRDGDDPSHVELYKISKKSGEEIMFALGDSDGEKDIVPTFDLTEKKWILPADRGWNVFNAEIATFSFDKQKQDIERTEIGMKCRGDSDWIPTSETRTTDKLWKRA